MDKGASRSPSQRLVFIDSLRGIAALLVVSLHSSGFWDAAGRSATWGQAGLFWVRDHLSPFAHGVDIFFVLSGFVIAFSIGKATITPGFFGNFVLRRSARLDPPYWVAMLIAISILAIKRRFTETEVALPNLDDILAHVFYLQGIVDVPNLIVVFWTLCIEVQLYLVFVFLLGLMQWINRAMAWPDNRIGSMLLVLLLASLVWPSGILGSQGSSVWFMPHWWKFLLGVSIAWALADRFHWQDILLVIGLILLMNLFNPQIDTWFALATGSAIAIGGWWGKLDTWLAWKPLAWIGLVSYSIYLLHVPINGLFLAAQTRIAPNSPMLIMVLLLCNFLTVILAASAMYYVIERPSIRLSKFLKRPQDNRFQG